MNAFIRFFYTKLLSHLIVAAVSILGTFALQQYAATKGRPILVKQVIRTDLSSLTQDVRRQIGFVPITYSLQNNSKATAQNVTIFGKSETALSVANVKFEEESEDHRPTSVDLREFKIDVPTIRPGGFVNFQILTTATNDITFTERSDNAIFESPAAAGTDAEKQKATLLERLGIAAAVFIWLPVIIGLVYYCCKLTQTWQEIDNNSEKPEYRKNLIVLISAFYIYTNIILGALGPVGMWVPLPRISFEELLWAFLFYLLVTRHKLLDRWLTTMVDNQRGAVETKSSSSISKQ